MDPVKFIKEYSRDFDEQSKEFQFSKELLNSWISLLCRDEVHIIDTHNINDFAALLALVTMAFDAGTQLAHQS